MIRSINNKYKKTRLAFKQDLKELLKKDKNLANFIIEVYCCEHNKNCLQEVYDWMFENCPEGYDKFCNSNSPWFILGNEFEIWRIFKGAYPEMIDKYMNKIPTSKALGDALAVLINNNKKEESQKDELISSVNKNRKEC